MYFSFIPMYFPEHKENSTPCDNIGLSLLYNQGCIYNLEGLYVQPGNELSNLQIK